MFDRFIFDSGRFDRESNNKYEGYIHGEGNAFCEPTMIYNFIPFIFAGKGSALGVLAPYAYITGNNGEIIGANGKLELELVMEWDVDIFGEGKIDSLNIGDIKTNIIYLKGISLEPDQTITIDTDSMTVLFGVNHDVSSLTDESIFFELNEGTNELKFEISYEIQPNPLPANELDTTLIWQNRWL